MRHSVSWINMGGADKGCFSMVYVRVLLASPGYEARLLCYPWF